MDKTFSTRTLLNVWTGCGVVGSAFSEVHEAIDHLVGETLFTHQLAQPEPWDKARAELVAQHPRFEQVDTAAYKALFTSDVDANAVSEAWALAEEVTLGKTLVVRQGASGRSAAAVVAEAMESIAALGKPVLVIPVHYGDLSNQSTCEGE